MLYEIHMLKNYPPVNLNRDDTGMPKNCYLGGALRGRVSSQCLKRAWRTSPLFTEFLGTKGIRTRQLPELVAEELKKRGLDDDVVDALKVKVTGIANKDGKESKDLITSQMIFFSPQDISATADIMQRLAEKKDGNVKKIKELKIKDDKDLKEVLKEVPHAALRPITMDIALFGRMVTSTVFANVDAAMQVAHAVSTHAVNLESDYFSAVDEIIENNDSTGAGMIGDTDFNSCCYYHYAAIDTDQLQKNLEHSPDSLRLVEKVLPAFIKLMAFTTPSGKQNSFAGHVLPELICVEIKEKKIPVSYVNAFADPVPFHSHCRLIEESIKRLSEEIDRIHKGYGLEVKKRLWFSPRVTDYKPLCATASVASLEELLKMC